MTLDLIARISAGLPTDQCLPEVMQSQITNDIKTRTIAFYNRSAKQFSFYSHGEFLQRAATFGRLLVGAGVTPGQRTVVACTSPEATLLAFFGSMLAGAVPAALPSRPAFDDAGTVRERIKQTLSLLGETTVLICHGENGTPTGPIPDGVTPIVLDPSTLHEHNARGDHGELPDPSSIDVAAISHIQLTSGSTGAGKGVAVTHLNVATNCKSLTERLHVTDADVFVSWLPLYHDMGLVSKVLLPLMTGASTYIMSPFDFLSNPGLWLETISEFKGTITASPNFGYDHVTQRMSDEARENVDLSSLKAACCGAEPVSAVTARSFIERFAPSGLRPRAFTPCYGLAEATLAVTMPAVTDNWTALGIERRSIAKLGLARLSSSDEAWQNSVEVMSLGTPMQGVTVRLVTESGEQITTDLTCGEIVVSGESVCAGWVKEGGVIEPFPADGLHTGDVGFVENGELFVVERLKNIIIRNGHNYSAQVFEQTLAEIAGISVEDTVVIDIDIASGTGLTGLVEIDKRVDEKAIIKAVMDGADQFEIPLETVLLVKRGTLPRTTSGKKRHIAVRELLQNDTLKILERIDLVAISGALSNNRASVDTRSTIDARNAVDTRDSVDTGFTVGSASVDEQKLLTLISDNVRARGLDRPVTVGSRLQYDLDFDSLGLLQLAMDVEDLFQTELDHKAIGTVQTVGNLLAVVRDAITQGENVSVVGLNKTVQKIRASLPQAFTVATGVNGREAIIDGRRFVDFASCNYLGIDTHRHVLDSVQQMHESWGVHRCWTRATTSPQPYIELEKRLADLIGVPDTFVFPTVTLLHVGIVPLLAGANGSIVIDTAAHKSMHEGAALARSKGTSVVAFRHRDFDDLETKLRRLQHKSSRIVMLDGVYSMSGAPVDLKTYQQLAEKYDATLYVDDAHGFGVIGENPTDSTPFGFRGNGVVKHLGCTYDRIIYVASLSKAYSAMGAFISVPTPQHRELFEMASTMVFVNSVSMATLAGALAGLDINETEGNHIRARLYSLTMRMIEGIKEVGYEASCDSSPIVNVVLGSIETVLEACNTLWQDGVLLTPSLFPAAPMDRGGVRFTITATNTEAHVDRVIDSLRRIHSTNACRV